MQEPAHAFVEGLIAHGIGISFTIEWNGMYTLDAAPRGKLVGDYDIRGLEDDIATYLSIQQQLWQGVLFNTASGSAQFNPQYKAYIQSSAWRMFRQYALIQAGNRCMYCGAIGQLHVHHKRYERFGRETMCDVEVLCVPCHARADEVRRWSKQTRSWSRRWR